MDSRLLVFWLEVFLCVWLSEAASENFVVSVSGNVSVHTKHTAILPCWLSPQQSAEDMEVNWFIHNQFDAPVMSYKDKTINSASQPASYSGRVSFGQREASSGGLREGDATLKLVNVTLADAGDYTCYVSSDKHHDRASFSVFVRQTGEPPLLTAVVKEDDKVNVSCESEGWYPEPQLRWSDGSRTLTPRALEHSKASSGLVSVHSWLIVPSSSALSCLVGLPGEEAIQGRIRVETPNSQPKEGSVSSNVGWVLFAIAAVALVALGLLFLRYRGKCTDSKHFSAEDPGELEKLLPMNLVSEAKKHYVNIELEENGNEYIKMKGNMLRDSPGSEGFPDGDRVTRLTAVRGTYGFTSGKHYWEVSLFINGKTEVPTKKSWWIGVTSQKTLNVCGIDQKTLNVDLSGFWFLSSSPEEIGVVRFNANTDRFKLSSDQPKTIGVFLDYEDETLTFYDVEKESLICSFCIRFSGEVYPLFNPGKGDVTPMTIIHNKHTDESTTVDETGANG
ncbi:butyrophilin subfamily 1 member A1-like [Eucyclogobius newberryi]|uniref:butyrophilin subfamily 1 member A1-like n=1 Tax=Eucyclogobius newberryi TaxID=166745 RepID=UPI003B5C72DD